MITVYVSIGNSDDKLTQAEWAAFYRDVSVRIRAYVAGVHGQWVSEPASAWQNACWCVELRPGPAPSLKALLGELAAKYRQDSIAWAEAPKVEFLAGVPS